MAIEGGRWEIYVGGAAGAHIRKGDLLSTVDTAEEAQLLTGRFLQYYRESANWLERTYAWVPRVGIEHIRAVVVEDAEGIAERLDAAVQQHADTYVDPWTQGREPLTPGQFRTSLPLEVLPRVPAGRAEELLGGPGEPRACGASSTGWAPWTRSRSARAATFAVAGEQVAVFRLRGGRWTPCPPSARTAAGRSPTARPTSRWSSARCTRTPSSWPPAARTTGAEPLRSYPVAVDGDDIVVTA